jgi:hypothetical protein
VPVTQTVSIIRMPLAGLGKITWITWLAGGGGGFAVDASVTAAFAHQQTSRRAKTSRQARMRPRAQSAHEKWEA